MALLNIFKKKKIEKRPKKRPEKKEPVKKILAKKAPVKAEKKKIEAKTKQVKIPAKSKKTPETASLVLKEPQVTEKATDLVQKNQYVFKVFPDSNKKNIKRAIEDLYGIDVVSVKVINVPRKARRLGRVEGWRKGYKKAIIRIAQGQKIEVLPR